MNLLIPRNIILHCSATEDGRTFSWGAIRDYHTIERGWRDIGYHYGIELYGPDYVLLQGRNPLEVGAHCKAQNKNFDSLGVCVVGNFDNVGPEPDQYWFTVKVLAMLAFTFGIVPQNVFGHREFESRKTCPGMEWDLNQLRVDVAEHFSTDYTVGHYLKLKDILKGEDDA